MSGNLAQRIGQEFKTLRDNELSTKVDKINGMGLSEESYTTAEKNKLIGIAEGAEVNVNSDWNATSGDAEILNKPTTVSGYGITDAYTKTEVDGRIEDLINLAPATLDTFGEIAAQLTTDEGAVAALTIVVDGKANKATTLAGYAITDAYTKTEIDASLNNKVDKIVGIDGAVTRFDGTTGAIKTSPVTITDDGRIFTMGDVYAPNLIGNATTAARLKVARTINGVPFDGTANINIIMNAQEVIKFDSGNIEGTDRYTFDGSTQKAIDIKAGTNVTLAKTAGEVTINSNDTTKVSKVTSTDNAVVRFDGTTGAVQNSGVVIDDNNNVGIGKTPSYKLDVAMPSDGTIGVLLRSVGATNNPLLSFSVNESTRVSTIHASGSTSGILALAVDNTERMRIDSAGNVGIGVTPFLNAHMTSVGNSIFTINKNIAISGADYKHKYLILTKVPSYGAVTEYVSLKGKYIAERINSHVGVNIDINFSIGYGNQITFDRTRLGHSNDVELVQVSYNGNQYLALYWYSAPNAMSSKFIGELTHYDYQNQITPDFLTHYETDSAIHSSIGYTKVGITFNGNMSLDSAGNVGIGVTPSAWGSIKAIDLGGAGAISSSGTMSVSENSYYNGTNWVYKNSATATLFQQPAGTGTHVWYNAPSGTAGNAITWNTAMTLNTFGSLSIPSDFVAGYNGTAFGTVPVTVVAYHTSLSNQTSITSRATSNTDNCYYQSIGGVEKASILANGTYRSATNSYGSTSDAKLKENIQDASPKLDKLMQVQVRTFNYIGQEDKQIGVVAQEIEQIFPSIVYETKDTKQVEVEKERVIPAVEEVTEQKLVTEAILDEEGNVVTEAVYETIVIQEAKPESIEKYTETETQETGEVTKNVKYSVIYMMMLKGMQEQQEIINNLKARIEVLESK